MGVSDFLRRRWYWILGILTAFVLFLISPILFVVTTAVLLLVYFLAFRRRSKTGDASVTRVRVGVVRSYDTLDINDLKSSKVCFNVDIGDWIVRIGDNWISALWLGFLDSSLMGDVAGLGAIINDGNDHYLVIYGNDINDVLVRLNTAVELLRTRNVVFRQLEPSELVSRVVFRWAS
jgi:hypothetical protein